ncbi:MAG TPA: CYTH and CHAD domain-containing protein [Eoetvoesiella sp.]|uniref:CYTH and CHAD domain-containing protein n=1 Tax=Eoetvoesiella sp. TaxID=1966355 RepID=UPI002C6F9763|nr:CYTH and CHAD domain-containing protein [Eoetvoesiella sp.]HWK62083.1 CYTH and CHAD domain-containing protein [Eoetvoesiella sp.]
MLERELKLHVPAKARTAIEKELRAAKARRIALHARYYDTAERELAKANVALRLRKEGRRWVQTVKAPGADALSRLEINHLRPRPELDVQLYGDTPFQQVLDRLENPLALRYETKVARLALQLELPNAVVEIAYDQGAIIAGELELPISEIEFELLSGNVEALFEIGDQWLRRHGLILDMRSKAERGDALAGIVAQAPEGTARKALADRLCTARKARHVVLEGRAGVAQAYQVCANECLAQIIQNTAYAAGVDTEAADKQARAEYVHQLRVGMRRLRSCWKLFHQWVPEPDSPSRAELRKSFGLFGGSRDHDVIKLEIEPRLKQAGMPAFKQPPAHAQPRVRPQSAASDAAFQSALLKLLGGLVLLGEAATASPAPTCAAGAAARAGSPGDALQPALIKRLNGWLKKIVKGSAHFESLPIETQHDLRKQVKNLRYCLDFSERLLPRAELESLRGVLTHIQKLLGDLNDYYVAEQYYLPLVDAEPRIWFAIGWLRSMQGRQKSQAQRFFKQLGEHGPFKT